MQSDNKYMDNPDNFSRKVGEKVRNHTQPVDASVWEGIEKRLLVKKRPLVPWGWVAASVAAVAIGLIFLLNPLHKESEEPMSVQHVKDEHTTTPKTLETKEEKAETFVAEKTHQPFTASKKRSKEELLASHRIEEKQIEKQERVEQKDNVISEAVVEKTIDKEAVKTKETEKRELIDSTTIKKSHEDILLAEATETLKEGTKERKQSTLSLLAAINGASVNANFDFADREALYADSYLGNYEGIESLNGKIGTGQAQDQNKYATLTPSDYSDVRHLPPISFSIMVAFPLNKTWSIETGLMYTYMTSLFSKPGDIEYSGRLMLHYLGVPVNLKATFFQNEQWNIYVSGGGSIEKGLFSHYRQQIRYAGGTIKHTNVRSRIDGVQLSVHAATGFGYQINDRIQLFGEPRIVYYFNNNQPMSARTENPITFGLNAGIKINF